MVNIKTAADGSTYREFIDLIVPFSKCKIGVNFNYPDAEEAK